MGGSCRQKGAGTGSHARRQSRLVVAKSLPFRGRQGSPRQRRSLVLTRPLLTDGFQVPLLGEMTLYSQLSVW